MTTGACGEGIYRDYGAMLLLCAAERMDAAGFTDGFAPYLMGGRADEDWDVFGRTSGAAIRSLGRAPTGGTASVFSSPSA